MKTGAELIAAERQRQIEKEGYTPEHDDDHTDTELVRAAICYAGMECEHPQFYDADGDRLLFKLWPWHPSAFKPSLEQVPNLVKAGALIAAEIDRLQRRAAPAQPAGKEAGR